MGAIATYSHSTLAEAAAGKKFPTWHATHAFLIGCGAIEVEIRDWRELWDQTHATLLSLSGKLGKTEIVSPTTSQAAQSVRADRLRAARPDLADPDHWRPRPEQVHTFEDLHYALSRMKVAIGNPGLRTLCHRMADYYSTTTLSDIFTGKRPPRLDVTLRLVNAMLDEADQAHRLDDTDHIAWAAVNEWRDAWNRAEFNRQRPDLTRHRRPTNVFLLAGEHAAGGSPTANIVAEMDTDIAAVLLAGLSPQVASGILTRLPTKQAQAILTAMELLNQPPTTARPAVAG
ncbi:hypothetical protein ACFWPK_01545 [Nocardia sp. NPDC058519]|uniref:hypothetical protein n=1 Tax=Nocardia sp. NPDC058519 TaxID=3346535 RepID=UPI00364D27CF